MLKKISLFLLCSFVAFLLPEAKAASENTIIINMFYHDARDKILASGWKPADGMPAYGKVGALAHYLRDLGYDEVYDCSGAGMAYCHFYFQNDKGEFLKIGTKG